MVLHALDLPLLLLSSLCWVGGSWGISGWHFLIFFKIVFRNLPMPLIEINGFSNKGKNTLAQILRKITAARFAYGYYVCGNINFLIVKTGLFHKSRYKEMRGLLSYNFWPERA